MVTDTEYFEVGHSLMASMDQMGQEFILAGINVPSVQIHLCFLDLPQNDIILPAPVTGQD